jgi:aspartate/tyrosine/aromatic aminotransferase
MNGSSCLLTANKSVNTSINHSDWVQQILLIVDSNFGVSIADKAYFTWNNGLERDVKNFKF